MDFIKNDNPCAACIEIIAEQEERLEFLEALFRDNCGNARLSSLEFSDNLEYGWEKYLKKFKNPTENV